MATPNRSSSPEAELGQVLEIVNTLARKAARGGYIFRGETRHYADVSSSLYRDHRGVPDIEVLQQADLDEARRYTHETDDLAILTELQHYGGHTNLIDFTTDYLIALFFACDGDYSQDGRVILLEMTDEIIEHIYEPSNPLSRVLAQKSVFVRPPEGYVVPSDEVIIPHGIKSWVLDYLKRGHGISTETIYNDLHGFIRSRAIHRESFDYFSRAVSGRSEGDFQTVIEWCDKALDLNPLLLEAYRVRGTAHYCIGSFARAISDFDRAIELDPDSAATLFGRGVAYGGKGDFDQAIADFNRAIELDSGYAIMFASRGVTYSNRGDFDQAIADFNRAIELDPDSAIMFASRGASYSDKGDFDQAISDFSRAIELDSGYAITFSGRGVAYRRKGDFDQAIADFDRAIELDSDNVAAHVNRGIAYARKGDYDHAIADYDRAIELDPNRAGTYANLGEAWLHQSDWVQARANLHAARGMGFDIVASFHNDYESVSDFEQRTGLSLPDDIAEMLGG